jgi:hypothetical protein
MPVFATKGVTWTWDSGEFDCPTCGAPEVFWHRSTRLFVTVGRLPVFPLNRLAEFVECQQCGHRYSLAVLEKDSRLHHDLERSEFAQHVVWVMMLATVSTRPLTEDDVATIQDVYEKLAGTPIGAEEVRREAVLAVRSGITPMAYVARFIEVFQEHGRGHLLLKAVERVMPSGDDDSGRRLLDDLRYTLGSGEVPAVTAEGR